MSSEEGVKTSKKRVREEDGDGNADAATEGLSSETKDLYHAIKAACTAKSFNEAVDLCTKALDEEHLSKAFRTKFLLARSSIYSQMENMFPMAIKDAKQAILLSPTHAMGYLRAANAFHQGGHKAKAVQALAKAASLADKTSELSSHIRDLQQDWYVPHIQALPIETLAEILGYLDMKDLMACMLTCRRWKDVTMSNACIWRHIPFILRGNLKQVDAKWKAVCKLTSGGQASSLRIDLSSDTKATPNELLKAWQNTLLRKTFPTRTLTEFEYSGRDFSMDAQVWSCITQCPNLKILRWKSRKPDREQDWERERNYVRCQIKGTPLAKSRLDEFHYDDPSIVVVDLAFTQIFSNVKRLYMMMYIPWRRQVQILATARKTAQELFVASTLEECSTYERLAPMGNRETEADLKTRHAPIKMEQVTSFGTLWNEHDSERSIISQSFDIRLAMPKVTRAVIKGCLVRWPDIGAWCDTLVHLDYSWDGGADNCELEIFTKELPNVETLIFNFNEPEFLFNFWNCAREEDEKIRILPKLKHLKLAGHPDLTGAELVSFIRFRIKLGTPIQSLHVYQCDQVDYRSIAWLRQAVPDFVYSNGLVGRQFPGES